MRFALNSNGQRIHINQARTGDQFFCPICGGKMIIKKGEINAHHFAHKAILQCEDGWHYDMSEWHFNWQKKFPVETQEIVKKHNGKTHRADILIERTKTVIEFQHSPLMPEEFEERNAFYRELGYKVIWLFDAIDEYEEGRIYEHEKKDNIFIWKRPRNTLSYMDFISNEDNIYLEFQSCASDNPRIIDDKEKMAVLPDIDDLLGLEEKSYFERHENDKGYIVKVAWIPETGFKRFAVSEYYSTKEFVDELFGIKKPKQLTLEDVYDKPRFLYSENHSSYYDGCPISTTRKCVNSTIDISENCYDDITPCPICKYSKYSDNQYVCFKRIIDLNLPSDIEIIGVERYDEYSLKSLIVKMKGKIENFSFKPLSFSNTGESVFDLWKKAMPEIAIFRNIRTGYYIKITKNPFEQISKYRKVYGKFSKKQCEFKGDSAPLFGVDKKEWVIVWKTNG